MRKLGHRVKIQQIWDGRQTDMMLALHARRSYDSIKKFATNFPRQPLFVVLTGTDLYRDIRVDSTAQESLHLATRLIVLQDMGLEELSPNLRAKTHVIYQSAKPIIPKPSLGKHFEICVIGHLREEKDPFRSALATLELPAASKIHVTHMGRALEPGMAEEAQRMMNANPRYTWVGEKPHWRVRRQLARSHLMVVSSRMEGGANVICEALLADVPVIASEVSGNIGMLGRNYAGYYPCGDAQRLAEQLNRAETDPAFYALLKAQCAARKPLVQPEREKASLEKLMNEAASLLPG